MFWVAPNVGAIVAAIIYGKFGNLSKIIYLELIFIILKMWYLEYIVLKPMKRDLKENLEDALYMAQVVRKPT